MLKVKGHRLLIKPDPPKDKYKVPERLATSGFKIEMDVDQERREKVATEVGTLVGIGPTAWRAYDGNDPSWEPWAKLGDRITFVRYAGKYTTDPMSNEEFLILNDVDMYCVVEGETNPFEG